MQHVPYLMEDPREATRLSRKVDVDQWIVRYLESWLPHEGRVLEVGCGPAAIAVAIGRGWRDLEVTAVDQNTARFSEALLNAPGNVLLRQADAHHLPFAANSFDLVFSRFMLEYLPDKSRAVEEMVRVCRPGGRIVLQDLDGQLLWHYPEDCALQSGIQSVLDGLAQQGFDPFVGRKLFSLMKAQSLEHIITSADSYHLFAGAMDAFNLGLWETKLDIVQPAAAKILGSESEARLLKQRFLNYLQRDDTLTYSIVFTVVGQKSLPSGT